jgi:phosphotransferase family enzyme
MTLLPEPTPEIVAQIAGRLSALQPAPLVLRSVFGSVESGAIAQALDRFCRDQLGAQANSCLFVAAGVGVVVGAELADGRQVVVKAHRPGVTARYLAAVQTAQRHMATSGLPAPLPLAGPAPLRNGLGTAETLLTGGTWADPHSPATRDAMAVTLARLAAAGRSLVDLVDIGAGPMEVAPGALWPTPHDPRFDFTANADGARWIDDLARQAREIQRVGANRDPVVGHTDWRVENMRFDARGQVCAVFDWDSLRILPEPVLAGKGAANYTTDWGRDVERQYPSVDEALGFIAAFEAARGERFDDGQRRMARAALVDAWAYISRCEHSDDPTGPGDSDSARALLRAHGESLLTG